MNDLFAARSQMGLSLGFHIIFACIGMVMPYFMAVSHYKWLRTGNPVYKNITKAWSKGVAIFFVTGAVSGTMLSFELGLLWPGFMKHAGPIIGMPFSLEGTAFFIEAIAIGFFLYGWERLNKWFHWFTGVIIGLSGLASGILVVAANSWMNTPAGFDYSLTEGPRETPDWWAALGVKPADGRGWSQADAAAKAMLAAPSGATGPMFLLFPNHFAIRKYNNSTAYALGIGLLADRFAGGGPLVAAWPVETPLGIGDRIAAQTALARLGFNPGEPDGVVGVNTRTALRTWQKARGITADGYLSMEMVRRLNVEATGAPAG